MVDTFPQRLLRAVGCVVLAVSSGCGVGPTIPPDTGPSEPHFATGTVLTIVSGEDDKPVAAASVRIAGTTTGGTFVQSYATDAAGRVVLDRPVLHSPIPELDVTASGYLKRETSIRSAAETTFTLWPTASPNRAR